MVLQHHNHFVYESYQKLIKHNISVYSVKTDAVTINSSDVEKVIEILSFQAGIGNWRVSKTKDIIYPTNNLEFVTNQEIPIMKLNINHLEVPDEYDSDAISKQLIDHKRVVVLGTLPGVGKSYACIQLENLGYNVLLVCPANELCKNNELAVTTHTFFSTGISEDVHMKKFDDAPYGVIVFDEIYLNDLSMLRKSENIH